MAKRTIEYHHVNFFEETVIRFKDEKRDFETISTTYTKRIKTADKDIFFNDKGKPDFKLLPLINMVREDAQIYLNSDGIIGESRIDFFNLYNLPKENEIYVKIDMRSAYWELALKENVISEKTNEKLKQVTSGMPNEEVKKMRTKALGALATTKTTRKYRSGIKIFDEPKSEPTKQVYLQVCRGVDKIMKECVEENPDCIYYYWDCIFAPKTIKKEVIEFFKKRKYKVSASETKLEYVIVGEIACLISRWDNKMYLSRRENKEILKKYIHE